jgi:hypothetical protein
MNEICLMLRKKEKKNLLKGLSTDPVRFVERGKLFILSIGLGSPDDGFWWIPAVAMEVFVDCIQWG